MAVITDRPFNSPRGAFLTKILCKRIYFHRLPQEKVEHFSHSRTDSCGFLHELNRLVAYAGTHRTIYINGESGRGLFNLWQRRWDVWKQKKKKKSGLQYCPYKKTKDTKQKKREWAGPGLMNVSSMYCNFCKLKHIFIYFPINYKNDCFSKFSIKKHVNESCPYYDILKVPNFVWEVNRLTCI